MENCPNCNQKIKSSVFGSDVILFTDRAVQLINEYIDKPATGYCSKCGEALYQASLSNAKKELNKLYPSIRELLTTVPVITLQNPQGWEYTIIKMITGQSTIGTGAFTEIASSFTDMVGSQSKAYNEKIKIGEENCFAQLRLQAMHSGANAVIGTDIDYAEMGGAKNMVMVCMSGTAIKITNPQIISSEFEAGMTLLPTQNKRVQLLESLMLN